MTQSELVHVFLQRGCLPHQADFAASFFAPNSPQSHLLVSGVGTGKTFMVATMVGYAMTAHVARRVLVLTPAPLVAQWVDRIQHAAPHVRALSVDRRRLRELEAAKPGATDVWPAEGVIVTSTDLAKQPDVARLLAENTWDFIIADEAQHLAVASQRRDLIEQLLRGSPAARSLFLRASLASDEPAIGHAAVTRWLREHLRDAAGNPLLPEVRFEWITYRREADEREVLDALRRCVSRLSNTPRLGFHALGLYQSASSSLFALEQRLRRMRQRRNEIAHGYASAIELETANEDEGEGSEQTHPGSSIVMMPELTQVTDALLPKLEHVAGDSKSDALLRFLTHTRPVQGEVRLCVLTQFVDTASYLESSLADAGFAVQVLTGRLMPEERDRVLDVFAGRGGVLISTIGVNTPLPEVAAVVFYDLPLNPAVIDAQLGRFLRVGGRPVHFFAFSDETESVPIERLQKKVAEVKRMLGPAEIESVLFPRD